MVTTAEEIAVILNSNYFEAVSIECGVAMSVQVGRAYFEPASSIISEKYENGRLAYLEALYKDKSIIKYVAHSDGYEVAHL